MYFKKSMFLAGVVVFLIAVSPSPSVATDVEFCYGPECSLPPERGQMNFLIVQGTCSHLSIFLAQRVIGN
jgi:hypothetical protein